MKLDQNSSIDAAALKGALLTNPSGAEFIALGVEIDLGDLSRITLVMHDADDPAAVVGVEWPALKDWQVQLTPAYWRTA